jgi:hypothetical protein
MKRLLTIVGVISFLLILGVLSGAISPVWAQGCGNGHEGKGFWSNLTDQQREAVKQKVEQMREQGASPEETHTAVAEMLKSYGVEAPDDWRGLGRVGHPWGDFDADLTDQQKQAVQKEIEEMKGRGASPLEMRLAVDETLESFGIPPRGPMAQLTDEQRSAVRQQMKLLFARDADEQEIREQMTKMLKEYGVEMPQKTLHPEGGFGAGLTDQQRQAIREKEKELRSQGASREEVRAKVGEMLKAYGVQMPKEGLEWHHPPDFGPWGGCFGAELTDEQRTAIHEKTREMKSQGATRQEIRAQVDEMLTGYGIEWPGLLSRLTDEQRKAVREKERQMRKDGAKCEEILAAATGMIEGYGLDLSQDLESAPAETPPEESHLAVRTYPNPFNPETQISYTLTSSQNVQIQIYNISGQLIRSYDVGYQPAGSYSVKWDGRTQAGDQTASGVYLYRVQAGPYQVTDRMILLK